jgi:hypothetical protein
MVENDEGDFRLRISLDDCDQLSPQILLLHTCARAHARTVSIYFKCTATKRICRRVYPNVSGLSQQRNIRLQLYTLVEKQHRGFIAVKITRLSHKIAIQLHLVLKTRTICRSRAMRPVRKLLDTPSYNTNS